MAKKKEPQAAPHAHQAAAHPMAKTGSPAAHYSHHRDCTIVRVVALSRLWLVFPGVCPVIKPMHQTVVEVNGHKFSMAYYIDALEYFVGSNTSYVPYYLDYVEQDYRADRAHERSLRQTRLTVTDEQVNQIHTGELSGEQPGCQRYCARAAAQSTAYQRILRPADPHLRRAEECAGHVPGKPEPARPDQSRDRRRRGLRPTGSQSTRWKAPPRATTALWVPMPAEFSTTL